MLKSYRFTFSPAALILFIFIMIPNIIWFGVLAVNDILRTEPAVPAIEFTGQFFQAMMIAALFLVKNITAETGVKPRYISVVSMVLLYYICWVLYYIGIVYMPVIIGLAVFPCLAFLLYAIFRKNYIAVVLTVIFAICHIASSILTYII